MSGRKRRGGYSNGEPEGNKRCGVQLVHEVQILDSLAADFDLEIENNFLYF